jgi:hypothetical protein
MTHRIPEQVIVPVVWNDVEHIWELDHDALTDGPLRVADNAHHDDRRCTHDDLHLAQQCDEIWGRSSAADMPTAEDLTHMLGFAMVRTTARVHPPTEAGSYRPASPGLVDMLDGAIKDTVPTLEDTYVRGLIRRLLPIFASVDENGHRRGAWEQRSGEPVKSDSS